jgi:hypothetical protein
MAKRFKKPQITGNLFGQDNPVVPLNPTPLARLPKPAPPLVEDRLLTDAEKRKYEQIFRFKPYPSKTLRQFRADIAKRRNKGGTIGL